MKDQTILQNLDIIKYRWLAQHEPVRPGATPAEIAAFEARHDVVLPKALRMFFTAMDGMEEIGADTEFMYFWPLGVMNTITALPTGHSGTPYYSRIEKNLPEADSYFAFAEHTIWVFVLAVKLSADADDPAPVILIENDGEWIEISPSFEEFLQIYAANPFQTLAIKSAIIESITIDGATVRTTLAMETPVGTATIRASPTKATKLWTPSFSIDRIIDESDGIVIVETYSWHGPFPTIGTRIMLQPG